MTRDRSLPIRAKGKDRARLRAAIRPHGKEAEERKAKETGQLRDHTPAGADCVLAGVYILIRKERCDSQDLTLHAVLSDGDNTVR